MERQIFSSTHLRGEITAIVTVGIDLAKNVFAVHGVDEFGKPVLVRPEEPRAKLLELIANLPPCLIGMEACSGAHHWAREFARFGHTVRMMAPKFVVPYPASHIDLTTAVQLGELASFYSANHKDKWPPVQLCSCTGAQRYLDQVAIRVNLSMVGPGVSGFDKNWRCQPVGHPRRISASLAFSVCNFTFMVC